MTIAHTVRFTKNAQGASGWAEKLLAQLAPELAQDQVCLATL